MSGYSTIMRATMTSTLNTDGESMPPSRTPPVGSKLDFIPSIQISTVDPAYNDSMPTTSSSG